MSDHEIPLAGGRSGTVVVRVGSTVRRSTGPWTPSVHRLLRHLEQSGLAGVPRLLGCDDQGREVLEFIEGEVGHRPWPEALRTDAGVRQCGAFLGQLHAITTSFPQADDDCWRIRASGPVICHGDLGPWNTVWREDRLVGVIDWDFARPDDPLLDVARSMLYTVPLMHDESCWVRGFSSSPDRLQRLLVYCDAYGGLSATIALDSVERYLARESTWLHELAEAGDPFWITRRQDGEYAAELARHTAWLANFRKAHEI